MMEARLELIVSNKQKKKGTMFESAVVGYLNESGFSARRETLHGSSDHGDVMATFGALDVTVECKNRKSMSPGWLMGLVDEADRESENAGTSLGVAVIHRDGCGDGHMGDSVVVMSLDSFATAMGGWCNA